MRAIQISGMKEQAETVISPIDGSSDERGDVGRSQEAISRKLADDNHVIVSDSEGRRFRRTAKPWPAG